MELIKEHKKILEDCIEEFDLKEIKSQLLLNSWSSIMGKLSKDESNLNIGCSKMFGLPDVPEYFEWPILDDKDNIKEKPFFPKYYKFLCQINLEEINKVQNFSNLLPNKGMLYFFIKNFEETIDNESWFYHSKIIYLNCKTFELNKYIPFDEILKMKEESFITQQTLNCAKRIEFKNCLTLPDPSDYVIDKNEIQKLELCKSLDKSTKRKEYSSFAKYYELFNKLVREDLVYINSEDEGENSFAFLGCSKQFPVLPRTGAKISCKSQEYIPLIEVSDSIYSWLLSGHGYLFSVWIKKQDLINLKFDNIKTVFYEEK